VSLARQALCLDVPQWPGSAANFFGLPANRVVELGTQVDTPT
jgi:K+ transporter